MKTVFYDSLGVFLGFASGVIMTAFMLNAPAAAAIFCILAAALSILALANAGQDPDDKEIDHG